MAVASASAQAPARAERALLYDRVSTPGQARSGYSGGQDGFQIDRCREHADRRGYAVVGVVTDVDSGATWSARGIMEALDRAKAREYEVLVVSDTSRFARNLAKKTVYEQELRKAGVRVEYLNLPAGDGPEARFMSNIWGSLDEYERERIAWRTGQGRLKKARTGKVVGGGPAPYGYSYTTVRDPSSERLVPVGLEPDPATAPVVARIFAEAPYRSALGIAARLTAEGVPTPTGKRDHWSTSSVRSILRHPVHKGVWSYAGIEVPVPALVDARTWALAQAALAERYRLHSRRARDPEHDPYTLRGLLTCGGCGGLLSASSNHLGLGRGRQRTYVCLRSQPRRAREAGWEPCAATGMLDAEGLERQAVRVVTDTLLDTDAIQRHLAEQREHHAEAAAGRDARLAILDAEIAKHERTLRRAVREKLSVEPEDVLYPMYAEAEARAADTARRFRAERDRLAAEPQPGLSDEAARTIETLRAKLRAEQLGARVTPGVGMVTVNVDVAEPDGAHITSANWVPCNAETYRALGLRGVVTRDPAGVKIGYRTRVTIAWEAVIPLYNASDVLTSSM